MLPVQRNHTFLRTVWPALCTLLSCEVCLGKVLERWWPCWNSCKTSRRLVQIALPLTSDSQKSNRMTPPVSLLAWWWLQKHLPAAWLILGTPSTPEWLWWPYAWGLSHSFLCKEAEYPKHLVYSHLYSMVYASVLCTLEYFSLHLPIERLVLWKCLIYPNPRDLKIVLSILKLCTKFSMNWYSVNILCWKP